MPKNLLFVCPVYDLRTAFLAEFLKRDLDLPVEYLLASDIDEDEHEPSVIFVLVEAEELDECKARFQHVRQRFPNVPIVWMYGRDPGERRSYTAGWDNVFEIPIPGEDTASDAYSKHWQKLISQLRKLLSSSAID